jgi:hypothetical protein
MLEQIMTPQLTLCICSIGTGRTDVSLLLLLGMFRVLGQDMAIEILLDRRLVYAIFALMLECS